MKFKIKNNKRILLQLLSGEAKAGWPWRMLWLGEQSPVSACLGQGDPRVQVKSNKGWAKEHSQSWVEIQLSKCLQRFFWISFFVKFHLFITSDSCKQHAEPCWSCLQGFLI